MPPSLPLLAAALAGLALCAASSAAPFVNWTALRDGAPRDEHVQALQLAKVRRRKSFFVFFFGFDGGLLCSSSLSPLLFSPRRAPLSRLQRDTLTARDTSLDSVSKESTVGRGLQGGEVGDALGMRTRRRELFFPLSFSHLFLPPTTTTTSLHAQANPRSAFELWTSAYDKVYKDEQVREREKRARKREREEAFD